MKLKPPKKCAVRIAPRKCIVHAKGPRCCVAVGVAK